MEAPEKLYLPKRNKLEVVRGGEWYETNPQCMYGSIEYIRKDAFIEKACDWLRSHSEDDYFELIPVGNHCLAGNLNKKKMIEDFKRHMED